jgi:DNA-binding transcriptional MerR regulator
MINNNYKSDTAYKSIGEIAKELNLVNKKTGALQTHTLRYWETQFKQIKPSVRAGNRRYYSNENLKIIKLIQFLLKEKGLTISGVKKVLNSKDARSIDLDAYKGINTSNLLKRNKIKEKINNIKKILKQLNKYK